MGDALFLSEDIDFALAGRQLVDGFLEDAGIFLRDEGVVGIVLRRVGLGGGGFEMIEMGGVAGFFSHLVEDGIAGEDEEPVFERGDFFESFAFLPDFDEDGLGEIFGGGGVVAGIGHRQAEDIRAIGVIEGGIGLLVAIGDFMHPVGMVVGIEQVSIFM
jgi:hypothetical protein